MAKSRLVIISEIYNATQYISEVCCDNMENDCGITFCARYDDMVMLYTQHTIN